MIDPVKTVTSSSSSSADRRGSNSDSQEPAAPPPPKPVLAGEPLRLVVEPKPGGQGYTYKLFDRVTGQLMIELPREAADKLSDDPNYAVGQVFDAKA